MPQATDSLGTWDNLGTLELTTEWQLFPVSMFGGKMLRFTYLYDLSEWESSEKYKSSALARFYYPAVNNTVSPSFRLYLKPQQEIRHFPYNDGLLDIGAKKFLYSRKYRYVNVESIVVRLQVEALLE